MGGKNNKFRLTAGLLCISALKYNKKGEKKQMNKNKIGIVFVVAVLALAGIGISYAGWTDTINVTGIVTSGDVSWKVIEYSGTWVWKYIPNHDKIINFGIPIAYDPDGIKNDDPNGYYDNNAYTLVASSWAQQGTSDHDVDVYFENLYPCTWFKADFKINYTGTVPGRVNNIEYSYTPQNDWIDQLIDSNDIYATARHNGEPVSIGYQLHENDEITIELWIHIPQQQDLMLKSGSFTASFEVKQWNEYVPIPPVAIGNGPFSTYQGIPITFDGSASYDVDGHIVLYEWDFDGDGTYDWSSTTTGVTTYAYPAPGGTFYPVLRVTDDDLMTATYVTTATIDYFYDNFNDNSLDTSKWTTDVVGSGNSFTETNQEAKFVTYGHGGWASGHSILWSKALSITGWTKMTITAKLKYTNPYTAEMRFLIYSATDPSKVVGITYATWTNYEHHHIRYYYGSGTPDYVDRAIPTSYATFSIVLFNTGTIEYWQNGVKLNTKTSTISLPDLMNNFKIQIGGWDASSYSGHMYFDDVSVTVN